MIVYTNFLQLLHLKQIDLEVDTLKGMLRDNTQALNSALQFRSELSGEVSGGGYPAGGIVLSNKEVQKDDDNNQVNFKFGSLNYNNVSGFIYYLDIYKDTGSAATDILLFTLEIDSIKPLEIPPSRTASNDNIQLNCPDEGIYILKTSLGGTIETVGRFKTMNDGAKDITNAGTAEKLSDLSTPCLEVWITAKPSNNGNVYLGGASIDNSRGVILFPAQREKIPIANLNLIFLDVDYNGEGVTYAYYTS